MTMNYPPAYGGPTHAGPPRPKRTGRKVAVGLLLAVTAVLVVFAAVAVATSGGTKVTPGADAAAPHKSTGGSDSHSGKIGEWAHAADGVLWTVSSLKLSHVAAYASGGHPGDAAVSVVVRVKNTGTHRIDLTLLTANARLGTDGYQAEAVFQEGYDNPTGTLGPNRTASFKFLFAADKRADLKHVSVEVAPGLEYQAATFEGRV